LTSRTVEVDDLSAGWVGACATLLAARGHEVNHLVVRMEEPLPENAAVRTAVDELLAAAGHQDVIEVRNTIFPAELAADYPEASDLVREYMDDYEFIKRLGSPQGTYFGRICAYPHPDNSKTPQLVKLVAKLREAHAGPRWRARYQVNVYAEHKDDNKKRNFFPCMAHLAFQLGGEATPRDRLDCVSLYRFQDMTLKGYGNFLGLAELQHYVAAATGFRPGELTVIAGHAALTLDGTSRRRLQAIIGEHLD
jgi:thymidylate synthase